MHLSKTDKKEIADRFNERRPSQFYMGRKVTHKRSVDEIINDLETRE